MSIGTLDIANKAAAFSVLRTQGIRILCSFTFDHYEPSSFITAEQVNDA